MKKSQKFRRKNFTLIEVVVVIIILVTLASIATPLYMNYVKRANIGAAKTQIKLLEDALTGYRLDMGGYPDSNAGLNALIENPDGDEKWNGPYLKPAKIPKDPWGREYIYASPGEENREYEITSYGADGQPGGTGDNADVTSYD